jgi:2'-5' RNA ligase
LSRSNWFVALPVEAGGWWSRVPPAPPSVRLFDPSDLHVTVAFLGPVSEDAAHAAFEVAAQWPAAALDVVLGPLRAMGNPRRASAFSSIVADPQRVLAGAITAVRGRMCELAGARSDDRPPLPHVTIARPGRRADRAARDEARQWLAGVDLGAPCVRLERIALYTWSEDRSVRQFRTVGSIELGDSPG